MASTWIVLLRGVNVGGRGRLPMAELREALEASGFEDVRTYIQSGNVVLRSPARSAARVEDQVKEVVAASHGLELGVQALRASDLEEAEAGSPFRDEPEEKTVHFLFLSAKPAAAGVKALAELAADSETFEVAGRVLHLHAPDGLARSKLAARAEAKLGVEATGRNLRTVRKLLELAGASPA